MNQDKLNRRQLAAENSRREILRAATNEFAIHGIAGAKIESIAKMTQTSKAMVYYYFETKEKLYEKVLNEVYTVIRASEESLNSNTDLGAEDVLKTYIEATFDFHHNNPLLSRIISIENLNYASALKKSDQIRSINKSVLLKLDDILASGIKSGRFRSDITSAELLYMINSLCLHRLTNGETFSTVFNVDLNDLKVRERHRNIAVQAVLSILKPIQDCA